MIFVISRLVFLGAAQVMCLDTIQFGICVFGYAPLCHEKLEGLDMVVGACFSAQMAKYPFQMSDLERIWNRFRRTLLNLLKQSCIIVSQLATSNTPKLFN
jgi:hypothetical protein